MDTLERAVKILGANTVGAAGARVIIKRAMRKMKLAVPDQQQTYIGWFVAHPWACTAGIERTIEDSARAWTRGNNSGNSEILDWETAKSERLGLHVETLMTAIRVKVDWPGLYPSYEFNGRTHYDLAGLWSAMKDDRKDGEA